MTAAAKSCGTSCAPKPANLRGFGGRLSGSPILSPAPVSCSPPDSLLWTQREGLPMWCPRADLAVPFFTSEKRALRERNLEEYRRLLYVALSRAQDRLYICGWQTREAPREDSWHALCRTGLAE